MKRDKRIIRLGSKIKDRNGEVVEGDWEREKEILRKMITGKIKLLFIGRKGKLERDIKKISRVKKKEIAKSFKGK